MSIEVIDAWFAQRGWKAFDFQREAWSHYFAGRSGLVHAPTGFGKTLSVFLGPVAESLAKAAPQGTTPPLSLIWITPLRALAQDTAEALREAIEGLGSNWTVGVRTGDSSSSAKDRARRRPPTVLVTTPESLSLLLSYPEAPGIFDSLRAVVVDEWHELLGTKRGVQAELCLARLRAFAPGLRTWGLSATLGNLDQALRVLCPGDGSAVLVEGRLDKRTTIETLAPDSIEGFPWSGHLGLRLLPSVVERISRARSTLLFTNTRAQAEAWHRAILVAKPDWESWTRLHHGSLDAEERRLAEEGLNDGSVRLVVCTSSLDLGVDFSPVDQVIQIGSPKGVARLMQRAGRSGHQPGAPSRLVGVPTHAWELIEYSAARSAVEEGRIEPRPPLMKPLDLLAQHLVTTALGGGFRQDEMLAEVRSTHAYADLLDSEWQWVLDFVSHGGAALHAYDQFRKVEDNDGRCVVPSAQAARFHRMSIGTITSDASVVVKFANGARIGTVEESFIGRLRPGDRFLFGGRVLELKRFRDMTATVSRAKGSATMIPRWMGGRMPLSSELADGVRERLDQARRGLHRDRETTLLEPLLQIQAARSAVPGPQDLLVEVQQARDGFHLFLYPFAGRLVHEGLASLLAWRIAKQHPGTFTVFQSDYGLELRCADPFPITESDIAQWLAPERLLEDILECLNSSELARRRFRGIARVAGLVFDGYPGARKTVRQVQASSSLLYDVFLRFDPSNLLLEQARREVLDGELEFERLRRTLESAACMRILLRRIDRLTPFSFPIWAERIREQAGSEAYEDRIARIASELAQGEPLLGEAAPA